MIHIHVLYNWQQVDGWLHIWIYCEGSTTSIWLYACACTFVLICISYVSVLHIEWKEKGQQTQQHENYGQSKEKEYKTSWGTDQRELFVEEVVDDCRSFWLIKNFLQISFLFHFVFGL